VASFLILWAINVAQGWAARRGLAA
jgi:hypothetical protein